MSETPSFAPSKPHSSSYAFFHAVWAIVWKDLAAELRSRELISAMLVFSLLMILIFNFALELDTQARTSVTSGVLWATFAFAGTLGFNRSMATEKDRGCLDGFGNRIGIRNCSMIHTRYNFHPAAAG